ncbi:MAG: hypothetical protein HY815_21595 [Candidatus Riflebacteria bacterium]|nr:hypothetical protein [Candidatus Riflebacteria bacterium]
MMVWMERFPDDDFTCGVAVDIQSQLEGAGVHVDDVDGRTRDDVVQGLVGLRSGTGSTLDPTRVVRAVQDRAGVILDPEAVGSVLAVGLLVLVGGLAPLTPGRFLRVVPGHMPAVHWVGPEPHPSFVAEALVELLGADQLLRSVSSVLGEPIDDDEGR